MCSLKSSTGIAPLIRKCSLNPSTRIADLNFSFQNKREIRTLKMLKHPNTVRLHETKKVKQASGLTPGDDKIQIGGTKNVLMNFYEQASGIIPGDDIIQIGGTIRNPEIHNCFYPEGSPPRNE